MKAGEKMKHNSEFIQDFMSRYEYPEEAVKLFTEVFDRLDNEKFFGKRFDKLVDKFAFHHSRIEPKILNHLCILAFLMGYKYYTLYFAFVLCLTEDLKRQYMLFGIDEKYYWGTMNDLKCKLLECMECRGVPGTFSAPWLDGFFHLDRIAYGRFEYEVSTYGRDEPFKMKNGRVVKKGDTYIGFHIPSSGIPLTDEVRYASYREAYEHVKGLFPDGKVLFGCGSWLLYPRHREFLPEHMNIRKFMDDFELVESSESDDFHDIWRIFGKDAKLPYDKLPRDTTLKKAYAEWLCKEGKAGSGFGLFLFDGEKII